MSKQLMPNLKPTKEKTIKILSAVLQIFFYGFVTWMLALFISEIISGAMNSGMISFYVAIFMIGWLAKTFIEKLFEKNE